MSYSTAYWATLDKKLRELNPMELRYGAGWYLFRCGRCKGHFVATSLAEWCDCGNSNFNDSPMGRIRVVSELTENDAGSIITWDEEDYPCNVVRQRLRRLWEHFTNSLTRFVWVVRNMV